MPTNNNQPEEFIPEDIRSEEVQEIMGRMPSWIIRRGISLVGILLLCLFIGAYFFKYPDTITSRVIISSANPPVKLVARTSQSIQHLLVTNNETVQKGQIVCILSNAAQYDEVMNIMPLVQQIDTTINITATILHTYLPAGMHLGELQSNYAALLQSVEEYRFFLQHNGYGAMVSNLQQQVSYNNQLQGELSAKNKMLQEQLELQHRRFAADSDLVRNKVISMAEYEESRKRMLDQQMTTEGNRSNVIQNNLQRTTYQRSISELSQQQRSEENTLQQKVKDAASRLLGQYAQWEQNYILRSPVAGKVSFYSYWKENQYVQAGEGVVMITPPSQQYIARGETGIMGAGKIKPGQKVLIKLTAYPYEEYGMLSGIVQSRSSVAMDSTFALEIKLPQDLKTTTGKLISQQPQIYGIGEILTENKSILQRLFEKVYGKWKR